MTEKYYVVMAYDAGRFGQSDDLYLIKLNDNKIVGYSTEFEVATDDIRLACALDTHHLANWFGVDERHTNWIPATMEEILKLKLTDLLIGSRADMRFATPLEPI